MKGKIGASPVAGISIRKWSWITGGTLVLTLLSSWAWNRFPPEEAFIDFMTGSLPEGTFQSCQGWVASPNGLSPLPGSKPLFFIHFYKSRYHDVYLDVDPTPEGVGKVRIGLTHSPHMVLPWRESAKQETEHARWHLSFFTPLGEISHTARVSQGSPINLNALWAPSGGFFLSGQALPGASGPLLRSIRMRREVNRLANLLWPLFFLVILLGVWELTSAMENLSPPKIIVVTLLLLTALSTAFPLGILELMPFLAAGAAAAPVIPVLLKRHFPANPLPAVLALLTLVGASDRWDHLSQARFQPLAPDASGFRDIAQRMTLFYDSEHREPLFILFVKLSLWIFGRESLSVRLVSAFFSVLLIPVIYKVGKEIFSEPAGWIAAALVANHSSWSLHASRGLRLECFTLGLLLLTCWIFTPRPPSLTRHTLLLGLTSAAICLVRITSLWFCLLSMAYAFWRRGWNTKAFTAASALTLALVVPFFIQCGVRFGDPFYAVNLHIKYYRNQELVSQGKSLNAEEFEKNPYGGPRVTAYEYFFKMHKPEDLVHRTLLALNHTFITQNAWEYIADKNWLLYRWYLLSLLVIVCSPHRVLLLFMVLLVGPTAWFFRDDFTLDWRLLFHVSVFAYLCMGEAVMDLLRRGHHLLQKNP